MARVHALMLPDLAAVPWRTGRTLGRTVYARTGGEDWKADTCIGIMDTRELAEAVVRAHNRELERRAESASATQEVV